MATITRTLALGGLGLAAGAGANNFDPYNALPFISLACLTSGIALIRFSPAEEPTSYNTFQELCEADNSSPMCQTFSILNNTLGTNDNQLLWNNEFAPENTTNPNNITENDMLKSVMWGTTETGLPFIATQYTSDKVQKCIATFFFPAPEIMNTHVTPNNCTLGSLNSQTNRTLFADAFTAFLKGEPLPAQVGEGSVVLQLGLPEPDLEDGQPGLTLEAEQVEPTPEPNVANQGPVPTPEPKKPEEQVKDQALAQERQQPEQQKPGANVTNQTSATEQQKPNQAPELPLGTNLLPAPTPNTDQPTRKTRTQLTDNSSLSIADMLKLNPNPIK